MQKAPPVAMPAKRCGCLCSAIALSAWAWFNVIFGIAAMAFVMLLNVHTRRRLALLEVGWLGRGQWLYLLVLWVFVIGNFGRIVVHFTEQRLLTEGAITLNAVLATMLVLLIPCTIALAARHEFRPDYLRRWSAAPRDCPPCSAPPPSPSAEDSQRASRLW